MGLDEDQVNVLKRCFDGFADEDGAIPAENVGNILSMMGLKVRSCLLFWYLELKLICSASLGHVLDVLVLVIGFDKHV